MITLICMLKYPVCVEMWKTNHFLMIINQDGCNYLAVKTKFPALGIIIYLHY